MNNNILTNNFNIQSDDVFKLFEQNKRKANIANSALKNKIIPFPGFDSTTFDENIWKVVKREKYGNSYTLYIHSLRVTVELMLAYEVTNQIEYFDKAEEIIYSWIKYAETDDDNKMIWYDHTTANRTQALIHYIYLANHLGRKLNYNIFNDLLLKHSNIMSNDQIYNFNNHGLMMDRSLMILGYILGDKNLTLKGKNRAISTFWYSYSSQGIHLENSPQYHTMVTKMYMEIETYLNKKEDSLGEHILKYLELAKKYIPIVTKPNQKLPSIGDSGSGKQSGKKVYRNIYDVEAGISVLQYGGPLSMFTSFIAGYSSKVHKHKDDLSITLNYKLKDFLVDPGKYSYTANKTRKYITSKEAHSSFYLSDFDYTIKNDNRYKRNIQLENYYENDIYTLVKGLNQDYNGSNAKLTRTVIQFKHYPIVVLVDCVNTNVKHQLKLAQNFNLSSDVEVLDEKDYIKLFSGNEEIIVKQFLPIKSSKVISGDINIPISVNTVGFGKVKETKQLKYFNNTNEKNVFVTALYDERELDYFNIKVTSDKLIFTINDENIYVYI